MLKNTGLTTDSWRTLFITSLDVDIETLTTTLWLQPFNQFLTHQIAHPSIPSLSNLEIRMWCWTISKVPHRSRKTISIALPLSTDAVTPSWKAIGLVRHDLPLVKLCYCLTSHHLLVSLSFQKDLFHDLPMCSHEAHWLVVP